MNADVAFTIGKTHRICQDYAKASPNGEYVILADGCSSSPDSDFGARLLVQCAEHRLNDIDLAIVAAQSAAANLKLSPYCIDATLLIAKSDGERINVSVYGDGVVAARRHDKTLDVFHIEYPSGYPLYLSYTLSNERMAQLKKLVGDNLPNVTRWMLDKEVKKQVDIVAWNGSPFVFSIDEYDVVAVFSDGVNSFMDADCGSVSWQSVISEMMDFGPSLKGEFIQRQLTWMSKQVMKRKWQHTDDFSMGAISMEKNG